MKFDPNRHFHFRIHVIVLVIIVVRIKLSKTGPKIFLQATFSIPFAVRSHCVNNKNIGHQTKTKIKWHILSFCCSLSMVAIKFEDIPSQELPVYGSVDGVWQRDVNAQKLSEVRSLLQEDQKGKAWDNKTLTSHLIKTILYKVIAPVCLRASVKYIFLKINFEVKF